MSIVLISSYLKNEARGFRSDNHRNSKAGRSSEAWQEVVNKMITAYKAPVSPDDAKAIVDYLVRAKGTS
jgi:hypothetical protein